MQDYEDATICDNLAMQRIFARNGCVQTGRSRAYVLHWECDSGHLKDVNALIQHLRAERHPLQLLSDAPVWLRVPMRFGRHAVTFDLGCSQDTRLLQILHQFPWEVPPASAARVALAVAALNANLSVPGFIFAEGTQRLGFRLPLFLDDQSGLSVSALRRALALTVHTLATYQPWFHAVLTGTASGDQASLSELFAHLL